MQLLLITMLTLVTVSTVENFTFNDRSLNVLEKLVRMAKDLCSCPGDKQNLQPKEYHEPIAFFATLTKALTLIGSQTVVYNKVYTNYGTAYDVKSGHFKAPVTGLYFFTATLMSTSGQTVHNVLVKNNKEKLGRMYGMRGINMGSTSAAIKLERGDTMSVQQNIADRSEPMRPDEYCTFAGYLITVLK